MKNTVEVGLNVDPDGFAEYAARCSILHITKLEGLPGLVSNWFFAAFLHLGVIAPQIFAPEEK